MQSPFIFIMYTYCIIFRLIVLFMYTIILYIAILHCCIFGLFVYNAYTYVTRHEKTGLMYTKYTSLYYGTYLLYCLRYQNSVNCIRLPRKCYVNGRNYIRLLFLSTTLFKFEIQKCGQILCAHKPYFLMPGHICLWILKCDSACKNRAYLHTNISSFLYFIHTKTI